MIQTHSNDPDVTQAAKEAYELINETLSKLPKAVTYDYGGHNLTLGEFGVCEHCTQAIAEAQAAADTLRLERDLLSDDTVKEHLELAAQLFELEAAAATIRAEFHNGHGTEPIVNRILGFQYERGIADDYTHNHESANN